MPWTPPNDPVTATIITVAYAVANLLTQIRWLRLLTGNADPPGTGYVVTADSVTATSWKTGLSAIVGVLGFTPINKAGDIMSGDLFIARAADPAAGALYLGSTGSVYLYNSGNELQLTGKPVRVSQSLAVDAGLTVAGAARVGSLTSTSAAAVTDLLSAGSLNVGANAAVAGQLSAGQYAGGSASVGTPAFLGVVVGASGISVSGGPIQGGTKAAGGDLLVIGLQAGPHGIISDAGATLNANSSGAFALSVQQANASGVSIGVLNAAGSGFDLLLNHSAASFGVPLQLSGGGAPITSSSASVCPGVNADMTDGAHASATPGAGRIPIADAGGKLDAWVTPAVAGATVPSGAIVAFNALASLTAAGAGWTRHTAADGRLLVGDGTTFGQAFAQGGSYGASWGHAHATPAHQHSGSPMSVSGTTGAASGSGNQANVATPNPANATQSHTHDLGTLGVAGNTANDGASNAGSTTWLPAMLGVVWGRKL